MRVPRIFGTRPVILSGIWSLALAGSTACQFPRIEPEASTDSSATDGESTADLCVAEDAFQGTGAWEVALDGTAGGKLGNSCVAVSAPERLFSWKSKADGTYRILAFDPAHVVDPALGYYLDTCDAARECSSNVVPKNDLREEAATIDFSAAQGEQVYFGIENERADPKAGSVSIRLVPAPTCVELKLNTPWQSEIVSGELGAWVHETCTLFGPTRSFRFVADRAGWYRFDSARSDFATSLAVFTSEGEDTACTEDSILDCVRNGAVESKGDGPLGQAALSVELSEKQAVTVVLGAEKNDATGKFEVEVSRADCSDLPDLAALDELPDDDAQLEVSGTFEAASDLFRGRSKTACELTSTALFTPDRAYRWQPSPGRYSISALDKNNAVRADVRIAVFRGEDSCGSKDCLRMTGDGVLVHEVLAGQMHTVLVELAMPAVDDLDFVLKIVALN